MSNQTDEAFVDKVALQLAGLPDVLSVALGGSRATGEHRADSDFDFAIYYRGAFDPGHLAKLGWSGEVSGIGEWGGGVMNGGAWLTIDGRRVDVHYRDLDEVEHHLNEAVQGHFKVERLPFYLAGIPTYVVVGELAVAKVLAGKLPKPEYPVLLREKAHDYWHGSAMLTLTYAESAYAVKGDTIGVAGALARAIVEESHARLAARGEWVLNEKRIVARSGLSRLESVFMNLSSDEARLRGAIHHIREEIKRGPQP